MTRLTPVLRAALCAALLMLSSLAASAQLSTATLFGTVTDSTGAAIPNATIVITQTNTNIARTLTSKSNGEYRAEFLPVGPYAVRVTATGFKALDRAGITLTVTEEAQLDLALTAGGASETVQVTEEIPLLNTGNSTMGRTIDNKEIDNLPLVDRNVYTLLDLTAGVQNNNAAGTGGNGGVINPVGFPEQHVKINGSSDSAVGQVAYYLDGGSNMTGLRNTGNPLPNPDAIQEFRVDTNNFSAQFGRNSAGVVSVITKTGTNQFHGSAFEFFRDRNFNATLRAGNQKLPYNQHRFGGTIGGPVLHDKLFFFGSYAGFRFVSVNTANPTVPSAAMAGGNFEENRPTGTEPSDATKCTVAAQSSTKFWACNPFIANKALAWCGLTSRLNVCPTSTFDPSILAILNKGLIPYSAGSGSYTILQLLPFREKTDEQLYKGDYQFTPKQRLSLAYFHQTGDYIVNPSGNQIFNWVVHDYKFYQHEANVQHVFQLSNSTVNQLAINFTRLLGGRVPSPSESLADYGSKFNEQLPNGQICGVPAQAGCARPQLAVSGWFTAGNAITGPVAGSEIYAIRDVVSSTHGRHTLAYGGEANRENDPQQTTLNNYGVFAFTAHTNTANRSSAAITDFFFGSPNTMNQDVPVYANANYFNYGAFLQDDWRIRPNLTVNLGIRYDIQTSPTNTQNETMQFVPGRQSTVAPVNLKGVLFPGDQGVPRGGVDNRYDHISPRVGMVFTPYANGKTVFHAGAGIFYGSVGGNIFNYPSNGEPFSGRPQFNNVIHVSDPYATDPKEFCNADPTCIAGGVGKSPYPFIYNAANPSYVVLPAALISVSPNFRWPVIYQVNAGFQQELTPGFAFSASYVGSFGRKLPTLWDLNYPTFNVTAAGVSGAACATTNTTQNCAYTNTTGNVDNRRLYNDVSYGNNYKNIAGTAANPYFKSIMELRSSESSEYNSLQVTVQKRLTRGLSAQGFYVWSKDLQSLDLDTTGNTGNSAVTEPEDNNLHSLDRQRSDYDQRHVMAASIVYQPHYGIRNIVARNVINGWTVTTILRIQSGPPFNITTGNDTNTDGVNNDRPNLIPGLSKASVTDNGHSRTAMINNWVSGSQFCIFSGTQNYYVNGVLSTTPTPACPQQGAGPGGSDGTLRQNALDSPGRRSIDASLFRDFPLYRDRVKFQLRGESTNVFNLTNLPAPVGTLSSSTFGRITSSFSGGSFANRIIQVGGRILF